MANRPEQELQERVVEFLDLAIDAKKGFFFAIRNETGVSGRKGAMLGAIAKKMGVKAGLPDLMVAHQECGYPVGIELKSAKGRQSENQKAVEKRFNEIGWKYHVCRSVDDVQDALETEGVPLRVKRLL